MSSIEQNQFNAEKLTVPGSTSIAKQADQQVLNNSKKLTNDTPINTRTVNVSKIIAIASGILAAASIILAILVAFHVVTFLSTTAIAALILSGVVLTIAAFSFGFIGRDEDDNIVFNTENNIQPSSMVDLISFLEKGQNLVAEISHLGAQLGEGGFGAVSEVTAQFVNKANEQVQNIRTKIVKKEYKNADGPSVINEVMINYILTQYIAKHREDPSLEKYFKSFPLLVLTPKQNKILFKVKSYEDLRERIENNISEFNTVYLEKKPGISLDKHIRSSNSFSSFQDVKEVFQNTLIALSLLNRLGIAHRDIKPGNMMIDGQNIFLLDFGTSFIPQARSFYEKHKGFYYLNQPYCASPEEYKKVPENWNKVQIDWNNQPDAEKENAFEAGTLLLRMCLPNQSPQQSNNGSVVIKKYCYPDQIAKQLRKELCSKFNEIAQDGFFNTNKNQFKFFRQNLNNWAKIDSKFCKQAIEAIGNLKTFMSQRGANDNISAFQQKIKDFEKMIEEMKDFSETEEWYTKRSYEINYKSYRFYKFEAKGWENLYNNIGNIIQTPENFLELGKNKSARKNYGDNDQNKVIKILRALLNPNPEDRSTCEQVLKEYFDTEIDLSKIPSLDIFEENSIPA